MDYRVGLENGYEGHSLAWVLDYPGCFVAAQNGEMALQLLPETIKAYATWITQHQGKPWFDTNHIQVKVDEVWQVYTIDETFELAEKGYEVNAWFRNDWKPLSQQDIQQGLELLSWSRQDFWKLINNLDAPTLDFKPQGERWSIEGIIKHVGGAEWWYLDRLSMAYPYEEIPPKAIDVIQKSREVLLSVLPQLENKHLVIGIEGEIWSPRKLLRRAVWHERDHTQHIEKLLAMRYQ